ncbi:ABC transporter permease [bacterium]|nr:ABC transporter permease [bacterium]
MYYPFFISKKYLWAKRKTGFVSVIAYISIAGVALGTAALIITMSIITGFERELRSKFITFDSHVRVKTFDGTPLISDYDELESKIRAVPDVKGVSPYVEKEAMIRSKRSTDGIIIKGIDQDKVDQALDIRSDVILSKSENKINLKRNTPGELPGALMGKKLADKLFVSIGDKVTVFSLQNTLAFIKQPKVSQFIVTGIYRSGLSEYDNVYVYIDITEAQKLFDFGNSITGVELRLMDLFLAQDVGKELGELLGYPFYVRTWLDIHRNLFGWLETNNFIMMIIFTLIIMVAAFNIIGTLFMIVIEKTKDIGVLKSMGAGANGIRNIFILEGFWIGLIGSGIGNMLALALCWLQLKYRIISLNSDVYFMDSVPIEMRWYYFLGITVFSIGLCVAATVFPSYRAAKLDPVNAIRYE